MICPETSKLLKSIHHVLMRKNKFPRGCKQKKKEKEIIIQRNCNTKNNFAKFFLSNLITMLRDGCVPIWRSNARMGLQKKYSTAMPCPALIPANWFHRNFFFLSGLARHKAWMRILAIWRVCGVHEQGLSSRCYLSFPDFHVPHSQNVTNYYLNFFMPRKRKKKTFLNAQNVVK